jgi:hypothetical protein
VVAPTTPTVNTTPSPAAFTAKLGSVYVNSWGCLTSAESPLVPPLDSMGRLSRHGWRSRTSPGTRAADVLVAVVDVVVLAGGSDVDEPSTLGTKAGVGFDEVPNPLLFRALTFAVYGTPSRRPETSQREA